MKLRTDSVQDTILPGWTQFAIAAVDKDLDSAGDFIQAFDKKGLMGKFDSTATSFMKKYKDDPQRTTPFVSTCVQIFSEKINKPITAQLAREIASQLSTLLKVDTVADFPIGNVITTVSPNVGDYYNELLAKKYTSLLGTITNKKPSIGEDEAIKIFEHITSNVEYYEQQKKQITNYLKGNYCKEQYLKIFAKPNLRRRFLNDNITTKYVNDIDETIIDTPELLKSRLELVKDLRKLNEEALQLAIKKLQTLISKEDAQADYQRDQKSILVDFLYWFFKKYKDDIKSNFVDPVKAETDFIINTIIKWFNHVTEWDKKTSLFRLAIILRKVAGDPEKIKLENSILSSYSQNATYTEGYSTLISKEKRFSAYQ